ncbi:MAG: hypothetical protein DRP09_19165 [Candidatus Thorarchaeota archaeon]|nr:MAG: hypothetical protein DRP09_19165 [Candidatus Thorarchaeota archaeon]
MLARDPSLGTIQGIVCVRCVPAVLYSIRNTDPPMQDLWEAATMASGLWWIGAGVLDNREELFSKTQSDEGRRRK